MATRYGLVQWYLNQPSFDFEQDFDNYGGESRDEVLETSSENFFNQIVNNVETTSGHTLTAKRSNSFKTISIGQISGENQMITGSSNWFDNQLTTQLQSKAKEQYLINDISPQIRTFNSEEDLNNAIKSALDNEYAELKKAIRRKNTAEETAELLSLRRDLIASYKEIKDPKARYIQNALDAAERAKAGEGITSVFGELE